MAIQRNKLIVSSAFLLGWLGIFVGVIACGWTETWETLLVPALSPPFADLRTVQGALESVGYGLNPQIQNPGDPWGRPMNYPAIWITVAEFLNFQNELNYLAFVSASILLFLVCCFRILALNYSPWFLMIAFSGSTLLAIERGNNDLIVFTLLYLAAVFPVAVGAFLVFTATAIKIYPLLAITAFIRTRLTFILLLCASAMLIYAMWPELSLIRSATPASARLSYGSASIAILIKEKLGFSVNHFFISITLLITTIPLMFNRPRILELKSNNSDEAVSRLFLIGASIYLGAFLLGSNWDYRLIFLILCLPYLFSIENGLMRSTVLASILAASNQLPLHSIAGNFGIALNILAKCFVFIVLLALVIERVKTKHDQSGAT